MNANITLLGVSGSGKTNFLAKAVRDINSFSPKITIKPIAGIQTAETEEFCTHQYVLKAYEDTQWQFSICDYNGDLLKAGKEDYPDLKKLYLADAWIVLIDGASFNIDKEADEKIVRRIKRGSARILLPYISAYADMHAEKMPELLFVVTKAKKLINKVEVDRIKNIVRESYEGIFAEEVAPMILLSETSNTKAAGLAVLSLFYVKYEQEISDSLSLLERRNEQIASDINKLQSMIYEIENQRILGKLPANRRKIEDYNRRMMSLYGESSDNDNRCRQYRNDMGLRYLGTCVQCLIDNNRQLAINGFERINYQYDKTSAKTVKRHFWITAVFSFNLCMLCLVQILTRLCSFSGMKGWWLTIGYAVWFSLSIILATAFDNRRNAKYQNDLVYFFNTKAKERK